MSLVIPDYILRSVQLSRSEMLQEIAILLFQQERLTLEQASYLAGLDQLKIQQVLLSRQIPLHYDIEDLTEDFRSLDTNNWR
ncbi:hypothetical protein AY600_17865 [Phormidium willei BDU 130791]|nr:hypothetical protein AY600_17865 [Phormidium willei BDU 130791]